jgi:cysteine desulfuration protein SufE
VSGGESIEEAQRELVEEFEFFDDWMDRYEHIIDLGRKLPVYPEDRKTDDRKVKGCQAQVWLDVTRDGEVLRFIGTSDSTIVAGLIAILLRIYDGRSAEQILATEPDFLRDIGLEDHLSPTRSNGLHAMLKTIKAHAAQLRS